MDESLVITIIEFPQFLKLPKDLIRKLINEYFDPLSVLRCFRVCKLLQSLISNKGLEFLQIKVVKQIALQKQLEYMDMLLACHCKICGKKVEIESMTNHMKEHEKEVEQGNIVQFAKSILNMDELCKLCDAPGPYGGPHSFKGCPLRIIKCDYYYLIDKNPWAEFACPKIKGYAKQMNGHSCSFKCKSCKELFPLFEVKNSKNELNARHLKDCIYKTETIKY